MAKKCAYSGDLMALWGDAWKRVEKLEGDRVVCPGCGRTVKVRLPMSQGQGYRMIPHHNAK